MATSKHGKHVKPDFKFNVDWHRYHVYNDPDFIAEMATWKQLEKEDFTSPALPLLKQEIADRFAITVADINMYIIGEIIYLEHKTSTASLSMDLENRKVSIEFNPFTTRAEVIEQWDAFEHFRSNMFPVKPSKRKTVQQPDLIYAIFKCRQRGLTFHDIFELYAIGKIPGYSGSTNQYKDEDSLEKYYQANKPTP